MARRLAATALTLSLFALLAIPRRARARRRTCSAATRPRPPGPRNPRRALKAAPTAAKVKTAPAVKVKTPPRRHRPPTTTPTTATTATTETSSKTSTPMIMAVVALFLVLGGIAFYILRDARSVAPVVEGVASPAAPATPRGGCADAERRRRRQESSASVTASQVGNRFLMDGPKGRPWGGATWLLAGSTRVAPRSRALASAPGRAARCHRAARVGDPGRGPARGDAMAAKITGERLAATLVFPGGVGLVGRVRFQRGVGAEGHPQHQRGDRELNQHDRRGTRTRSRCAHDRCYYPGGQGERLLSHATSNRDSGDSQR